MQPTAEEIRTGYEVGSGGLQPRLPDRYTDRQLSSRTPRAVRSPQLSVLDLHRVSNQCSHTGTVLDAHHYVSFMYVNFALSKGESAMSDEFLGWFSGYSLSMPTWSYSLHSSQQSYRAELFLPPGGAH